MQRTDASGGQGSSRQGRVLVDVTGVVVRRMPDLHKATVAGQGRLFPFWRYHAVLADSPFALLQAEEQHGADAFVEQLFAEHIDGLLAHLLLASSTRTTPG
jgi:hypothetical protein